MESRRFFSLSRPNSEKAINFHFAQLGHHELIRTTTEYYNFQKICCVVNGFGKHKSTDGMHQQIERVRDRGKNLEQEKRKPLANINEWYLQ